MADIRLTSYDDVRSAFRAQKLVQALYDEGAVVMGDVLLTLHGEAHRARRRLENRLFRREAFMAYESGLVADSIDECLLPAIRAGKTDAMWLVRRISMNMTATISGIDRQTRTADETAELYRYMCIFSEGATLVHSTRDKATVRREVEVALEQFTRSFLTPSIARRQELLEELAAGNLPEEALPKDILTVLLRNQDQLDLKPDVLQREIVFFLQAGAHSTVNATVHALHEIFGWIEGHPEDAIKARTDKRFVQRCFHEALRLHPASPVAWRKAVEPVELKSGTQIPAGALVEMDLMVANRDRSVFGETADLFDPYRVPPGDEPPWGLSFGGGIHVCVGTELDGGVVPRPGQSDQPQLFGTVTSILFALLSAGGTPDPRDPPIPDPNTIRRNWARYPVIFPGYARETVEEGARA